MAKASEKTPKEDSQVAGAKRRYVSPRLIEYGAIAKLTAGGAGTVADMMALRHFRMTCL